MHGCHHHWRRMGFTNWMLTRIFGVTMTLHSLMNCHCGWYTHLSRRYPSCPDGHELLLRGHALWSREGQSSSVAASTSMSYMGLRGTGGPRQSLLVLPQTQLSGWPPFVPPSWKILHPAVQNVHQPKNQHHW